MAIFCHPIFLKGAAMQNIGRKPITSGFQRFTSDSILFSHSNSSTFSKANIFALLFISLKARAASNIPVPVLFTLLTLILVLPTLPAISATILTNNLFWQIRQAYIKNYSYLGLVLAFLFRKF